MSDGVCDRIGCDRPAALTPVIEIKPIDHPGVALIGATIVVCVDHVDTPVEAFLDDEKWADVEAMFASKGLVSPDRSTAVMHWQPLPFESARRTKTDA